MTDRDPSLGSCPGGSRVRGSFGVLTRNEETYLLRSQIDAPLTRIVVNLTTNQTLNRVDPGLLGGCPQEGCGLVKELLWPDMSEVWAAPGRTLACPPSWVSVPPGLKPRQVKEKYEISTSGNSQVGCTGLPARVSKLMDLAPAGDG